MVVSLDKIKAPQEVGIGEQNDKIPSKGGQGLRQGLAVVVLIAFIGLIEVYVGWARLLTPWAALDLDRVLAALGLVSMAYGLRAVRLYDYFHTAMRGSFSACLRLTLQHNMLNVLMPMRTGEASFPLLMARYFHIPAVRSVPALLWFRGLDLHTLAALAWLAVGPQWLPPIAVVATTGVWMVVPYLAFRSRHAVSRWLAGRSGWTARLADALEGLPGSAGAFWRSWLWTLLTWAVKVAVFAWVLRLFVSTPWGAASLAVILGDLTTVLPIHGIAGAGTYEAGVVAGLLPFGLEAKTALAAAVNLHLFVLTTALCSGLVSLLPRGIRRHGQHR